MGERIYLRYVSNSEKGPWIYAHYSWGFSLVRDALRLIEQSVLAGCDVSEFSNILEEKTSGENRGYFEMNEDNMDWGVWEIDINSKTAIRLFQYPNSINLLKLPFNYSDDIYGE